jgi:hypothetical protein
VTGSGFCVDGLRAPVVLLTQRVDHRSCPCGVEAELRRGHVDARWVVLVVMMGLRQCPQSLVCALPLVAQGYHGVTAHRGRPRHEPDAVPKYLRSCAHARAVYRPQVADVRRCTRQVRLCARAAGEPAAPAHCQQGSDVCPQPPVR